MSRLPTGAYEACFSFRSGSQHQWEDPCTGNREKLGFSSGFSCQLGPCEASPSRSWDVNCCPTMEVKNHVSLLCQQPQCWGPEKEKGLERVMVFQAMPVERAASGVSQIGNPWALGGAKDSPSLGRPALSQHPGPRAVSAGRAVLCRPLVAAGPFACDC